MTRVSQNAGVFGVYSFFLLLLAANVFAQETTAGIQGTVKDASGAVVGGAHV